MNIKTLPVVMCGGIGKRLWPLSTSRRPKQFLKLLKNKKSFFQLTILRVSKRHQNILIICNAIHLDLVLEQIQELSVSNLFHLIVEPCIKNTAATSIIACLQAQNMGFSNVLLMPSDQYILGDFLSILNSNIEATKHDVTTFAIKPEFANTQYGYIEIGENVEGEIFLVKNFKEKPDLKTAQMYVKMSNYYWNSGMFLLPCKHFIDEVIKIDEELVGNVKKSFNFKNYAVKNIFVIELSDEFKKCKKISIDYFVMEKLNNLKTIKCQNIKWRDIGSWKSLMKFLFIEKDKQEST